MKKFIGLLIIATSLASPAFAQSFDPDNGTGNLVAGITAGVPAPAISTAGSGTFGAEANAMSARRKGNSDIEQTNIDNSAGGSPGYNEMLRNW